MRDHKQIMMDVVLALAERESMYTHLIQRCHTDSRKMKEVLNELIDAGIVESKRDRYFALTYKGYQCVSQIARVRDVIVSIPPQS